MNVDGNANRVAAITFWPRQRYPRGGLQQDRERPCRRRRPCQGRCRARQMPSDFSAKRPAPSQASAKTAKVPAASAAHTCCTAHQRVPGRIKVILVGQGAGLLNPNLNGKKGRVLNSTRPFLFSLSNLPCRLAPHQNLPKWQVGALPEFHAPFLRLRPRPGGSVVADPLT